MEGIGGLIVLVLVIVPLWRICTRAGFSGWWSLLVMVPLLNLIMLWVFAYAKWPRDPVG
jgi:uncharacterized membrane protein YhaH (DUF805 family)